MATYEPPSGERPVPEKPAVVTWFQVYCGFMGALYLLVILLGAIMVVFRHEFAGPEDPPEMFIFMGSLYAGMGLVFGALYLSPLVLPRRPWVWIYDIVLIALGMTSLCCLPITIPLLIYWIKPEVQVYFGRRRPRYERVYD